MRAHVHVANWVHTDLKPRGQAGTLAECHASRQRLRPLGVQRHRHRSVWRTLGSLPGRAAAPAAGLRDLPDARPRRIHRGESCRARGVRHSDHLARAAFPAARLVSRWPRAEPDLAACRDSTRGDRGTAERLVLCARPRAACPIGDRFNIIRLSHRSNCYAYLSPCPHSAIQARGCQGHREHAGA